ncbi:MAG: Nramp family divalent metal transporter [Pseudomonadales bacterium]|nr:Nramp family divalent metal transporter [Pseudomonadales bacterium]
MMKTPIWKSIGPGFVIAATGLGAGDLIAATVAGVKFSTALLWAVLLGALLKGALNEGLARWQLQTGTTLLEGWIDRLPSWIKVYFGAYLILWSFLVSAALMAACGLAANTLAPSLSINQWAIIHSVLAAILVLYGKYSLFENMMKLFIGLMFVTVLVATAKLSLDWGSVLTGFIPTIPEDSLKLILGVVGGVGGSVTLLCYGYWIKEKQWVNQSHIKAMRIDLILAYSITALFGICIVILAAHSKPEVVKGSAILVALANQLEVLLGDPYPMVFLIGFWGAVFSSMLGVWQGVPYLFADFTQRALSEKSSTQQPDIEESDLKATASYKVFLAFLTLPPFIMLYFERPIWLAITYAVAGAFFMPFLAGTLLYMNNKKDWMGDLKNRPFGNGLLIAALLLFIVLLGQKLLKL